MLLTIVPASFSPNWSARLDTAFVMLSTGIFSLYVNQWFWASTLALSIMVLESAISPLIAQPEQVGYCVQLFTNANLPTTQTTAMGQIRDKSSKQFWLLLIFPESYVN